MPIQISETPLVAWNFDIPNAIDAINDGNFTQAEQDEIDSHINMLQMFYNLHATLATAGTVLASLLLCLTLSRVWEIKSKINQGGMRSQADSTALPKNVIQLLIFNIFGVLAPGLVVLTYTGVVGADNTLGCDLVWKLVVCCYLVAMHMSYWILLGRAHAVLCTAFFPDSNKTKRLFWLVHKASYLFYFTYTLPFFTQGHVPLPPNICTYYSSPLLMVSMLVGDFIFSSLLLALFLLPMFALIKVFGETGTQTSSSNSTAIIEVIDHNIGHHRQIKRTVRRQFFLSLIALSSTLIMSICLTIVNSLAGDSTLENLGSQYWRVAGGCVFITECMIKTISIHFITNAWQPSWFKRAVEYRKHGGTRPTNTLTRTHTISFSYTVSGEDAMLSKFSS